MSDINIMFIEKILPLCEMCDTPIDGEIKEKNIAICHPATTNYTIKICEDCFNK